MKTINISGEIGWEVMPQQVRDQLEKANGEDITAIISSPGGYVSDGIEIFNLFRNYKGHKTAVLSGFAMSMASYIPMAFDEIHAEDNAVFMIHNVRGGVWGDHKEILHYGGMVKGLSGMLSKEYSKHTGKAQTDIAEMMDVETYFFGEEIVTAGFASKIIETDGDKDTETARATAKLAFQTVNGKLADDQGRIKKDLDRAAALALGNINGPKPENKKDGIMDLKELRAKHPDLVTAIESEATTGMADQIKTAKEEGAKAERDRIKAVHGQTFPGFEAIVTEAMFDGESSPGDVAMKINAANLTAQQKAKTDLADDAPAAVKEQAADETPTDSGPMTKEKAQKQWDKDSKIRAEFGEFETFLAYAMEDSGVKVKLIGGRAN